MFGKYNFLRSLVILLLLGFILLGVKIGRVGLVVMGIGFILKFFLEMNEIIFESVLLDM